MTPTVLHLFAGIGGGGLGFKRAGFRSLGAVDFDAAACRDYERITGDRATVADLATLSPADLGALAPSGPPDVLFTSPPCKGFSGCLPEVASKTPRYQDMNSLVTRGIWIALEAWRRPPPLIIMENVPRITTRGRAWLDQVVGMLRAYGYAVRESVHDCAEIGGLGQRRRRFLLVARHMATLPEFLYTPPIQRPVTCGDVLGTLPVPTPEGVEELPLHRLPRLSARNWLRLAAIPAGGDWRDLPEAVAVSDLPNRYPQSYGVQPWDEIAPVVRAQSLLQTSRVAVADPREAELYGPTIDINDRRPVHLRIIAADGSWHRPMTTMELAALQGFPATLADGSPFRLDGSSDRAWRTRIGNAVPPPAAEAIARTMLRTLSASRDQGPMLCSDPVWVAPLPRRGACVPAQARASAGAREDIRTIAGRQA